MRIFSTMMSRKTMMLPSLCFLLCILAIPVARGDNLDTAMENDLMKYNVRGAGVTVYDAAQLSRPISRGYGKVGGSSNSGSVTPDTTFMLASVSKVFTAAAVSVLIDRGIITLDDDICDVIPASWERSACRNPSYPNDKVTWRMLVTHRSSLCEDIPAVRNQNGRLVDVSYAPTAANPTCPLKDVTGFYRDFLTNKPTETSVGASMTVQGGGHINWYSVGQSIGGAWQSFRPGSRVSYSNFAVGYVAALVELASGMDFADFCHSYIFQPLGMSRTAWFREDLPAGTQQVMPVEFLGGTSFGNIGHYCFIDYASGQLFTTANDMAKWAEAMLNYGAPILWSRAVGEEVFKCQERNAQGNTPKNCEFGMGWSRLDNSMKANAESYLNAFKKYDWTNGGLHEGAESGVQTHLIVLPSAGVFASVLTNTDLNDEYAPQKMTATLVSVPLPNQGPVATPSPTKVPTPPPNPTPTSGPNPTRSPTLPPVPPPTRPPTVTPPPASPPTRPPTRPPTPSPAQAPQTPQSCQDSSTQIWINNRLGFQSCSWFAGKPYWQDYLCGWDTDADYYCRYTCDSCDYWSQNPGYIPVGRPSSCFDLEMEFFVNKNLRNCDWLAGSSYWQKQLCGYDTDADYACRKTCGSCDYWN